MPNSVRGLTVPPDVICISCDAYPTLAELTGRGGISTAQIKHMKYQLISVCNFTHPPILVSHGHTFKCLPLTAREHSGRDMMPPSLPGACTQS